MFGLRKDDRVKTTSNRYFGIVQEVKPGGFAVVLIKKAKGLLHVPGDTPAIDVDQLLLCKPFFSKGFLVLLGILALCLFAPIGMGDAASWLIWCASAVLSFGARSYQYFVQWR